MAKKLTTDLIKERLLEKNPTIKLVGEYNGSSRLRHDFICENGHIFNTRADNILSGNSSCLVCAGKKVTTEIVKERLLKQNRGIKLIGDFNGSVDNKHEFICENNHTWSATVYDVTKLEKPTGCPTCSNKLPLNDKIVSKRLEGRNITMLDNFKGSSAMSHNFKCNECDHTWNSSLNNILGGKGCRVCAGNEAYTLDKVLEKLDGRNITLISEFNSGIKHKYSFRCDLCNHEWDTSLISVIGKQKTGCGMCVGKVSLTTKVIKERLLKQNRGIKLIGEYNTNDKKHHFECKEGHRWYTSQLYKGCPICAGNFPYTLETFNKKIEGRNITLISEFIGTNKKHNFICDICDSKWLTTCSAIISGSGCPSCAEYGFHPNRESELYFYKLKNEINIEVIGFGISNNFNKRHLEHLNTFKKYNIHYEILYVFKFKDGFTVREIERIFKNNKSIVNFGIVGFRSECLPSSYLQYMLDVVEKYK